MEHYKQQLQLLYLHTGADLITCKKAHAYAKGNINVAIAHIKNKDNLSRKELVAK